MAARFGRTDRLPASARLLVREALKEDLGRRGDVTTRTFVPPRRRLRAELRAKASGVVCGTPLAGFAFSSFGARARVHTPDGRPVRRGSLVMSVEGPAALLSAERVALNFLQRLSGIATLTREHVRLGGPRIFDTRKTTPGWRTLEKYAVRCGGGRNHRLGLHDAGMVKDNHWAAIGGREAFLAGVVRFRRRHPTLELEVEAQNGRELDLALEAGADTILLDNHSPARLRAAVRRIRSLPKPPKIEVSGGIRLKDVRRIAALKPDRISIGRLTHSAPSLDLSLEVVASLNG